MKPARPLGLPRGTKVFQLGKIHLASTRESYSGVTEIRGSADCVILRCRYHIPLSGIEHRCHFERLLLNARPVTGSPGLFSVAGAGPESILATHARSLEHQRAEAHQHAVERGSVSVHRQAAWKLIVCRHAGVLESFRPKNDAAVRAEWIPKWVIPTLDILDAKESKMLNSDRATIHAFVPLFRKFHDEITGLLAWAEVVGGTVRSCVELAWPGEGLLKLRGMPHGMRMAQARRAVEAQGLSFDDALDRQREDLFWSAKGPTLKAFLDVDAIDPDAMVSLARFDSPTGVDRDRQAQALSQRPPRIDEEASS